MILKVKTIYGWQEQNESSYGVRTHELEEELEIDLNTEVNDDGQISVYNDEQIPEGFWFLDFNIAKKACLQFWKDQLSIAKNALKDIRKIKDV